MNEYVKKYWVQFREEWADLDRAGWLWIVTLIAAAAAVTYPFVDGLTWLWVIGVAALIICREWRYAALAIAALGVMGVSNLLLEPAGFGEVGRLEVWLLLIVGAALLIEYPAVLIVSVGLFVLWTAVLAVLALTTIIPGAGTFFSWQILFVFALAGAAWGRMKWKKHDNLREWIASLRDGAGKRSQLPGIWLAGLGFIGLIWHNFVFGSAGFRWQRQEFFGDYIHPEPVVYGLLLVGVAVVFFLYMPKQAEERVTAEKVLDALAPDTRSAVERLWAIDRVKKSVVNVVERKLKWNKTALREVGLTEAELRDAKLTPLRYMTIVRDLLLAELAPLASDSGSVPPEKLESFRPGLPKDFDIDYRNLKEARVKFGLTPATGAT